MHALTEIQTRFLATMISAAADTIRRNALLELLDGDGRSISRRIQAYRRNVFANLCTALTLSYPLIRKIVGERFFVGAIQCYVQTHPSLSGDLNDYGGDFADFLSDYRDAQEMPYLADLARLEWQMQTLMLSADPSPPSEKPFEALATTPPACYDQLVFHVNPARARMNSIWPLFDIWRVNQPGYDGDMRVDFTQSNQLLIWRQDAEMQIAQLDAADAALLDALVADQDLATAAEAALAIRPDFDLGAALQRWIAVGLVSGVKTF